MNNATFFKFSGAGNTFAITWSTAGLETLDKDQVLRISDPVRGFAVDGVLIVKKHSEREFSWEFYNSDGSRAEMCGNAARSVALFLKMSGLEKEIKLNTQAGAVFLNPQSIAVEMRGRDFFYEKKNVQIESSNFSGLFVDSGVPHFIIEDYSLSEKICSDIRQHNSFQPRGTNVTLFQKTSTQQVKAKTYERGVEGFTLACGTGALAVAGWLLQKGESSEIEIAMPGGVLRVEKLKLGYRLTGDTEYIGSFKI